MTRIDLNCDLGELPEAIADGTQEALLRSITSANVACGGHAGDERTMRTTIEQALRAGVAVGAHPGYPDRENFGRLELKLSPQAVADSVCDQVRALAAVAAARGAKLVHVKPHGALYNQAVKNRELAEAIAQGVVKCNKNLVLMGLAESAMLDVFRDAGFAVAAEAFADRRYEPDGTLRSRKFDNALIRDPARSLQERRRCNSDARRRRQRLAKGSTSGQERRCRLFLFIRIGRLHIHKLERATCTVRLDSHEVLFFFCPRLERHLAGIGFVVFTGKLARRLPFVLVLAF